MIYGVEVEVVQHILFKEMFDRGIYEFSLSREVSDVAMQLKKALCHQTFHQSRAYEVHFGQARSCIVGWTCLLTYRWRAHCFWWLDLDDGA